MRFFGRRRGSIFNVGAILGWIKGVDRGGALGELQEGNLRENDIATEGGYDSIIVC